jgi:hypothetical protein
MMTYEEALGFIRLKAGPYGLVEEVIGNFLSDVKSEEKFFGPVNGDYSQLAFEALYEWDIV